MRILYHIDQLYLHGGAERVTTLKANGLIKYTNNEVIILTYEQRGRETQYNIDKDVKFIDLGINYYRNLSFFHPLNIIKTLKHIFLLKRQIVSLKPDVIICVLSGPDSLFLPLINGKIPLIKEYHSSRYNEKLKMKNTKGFFKKSFYTFSTWIERKYSCCIALNKDELPFFNSNNVKIISNPIEVTEVPSLASNNKIVIAAGRISPVKGYDMLIDSWKIVNISYPDWKLHIFGDGDDQLIANLKNRIEILKIQNSAFLLGATTKLKEELRDSSIFVMSSRSESFGMVILEAQAEGLPVVAFDCPTGPRNIIHDGIDGLLAHAEDINDLANKIITLIKDSDFRKTLGENGKENVKRFALVNISQEWNLLFSKLVKNEPL